MAASGSTRTQPYQSQSHSFYSQELLAKQLLREGCLGKSRPSRGHLPHRKSLKSMSYERDPGGREDRFYGAAQKRRLEPRWLRITEITPELKIGRDRKANQASSTYSITLEPTVILKSPHGGSKVFQSCCHQKPGGVNCHLSGICEA